MAGRDLFAEFVNDAAWESIGGKPMDVRIAERVAELQAKRHLTRAEAEELAILTYSGPVPRRLPPSDEVPF